MKKTVNKDYFRSALFGFEDALVSTTGTVVGISAGTSNTSFIILATLVTVIVEALSMGTGEYLTEKSVHELDRFHWLKKSRPSMGGLVMFFSYLGAGLIPVIPIIIFPYPMSAVLSTFVAFLGLFALGYVKGRIVRISPIKSGAQVLLVGGIATLAGLVVGIMLRT